MMGVGVMKKHSQLAALLLCFLCLELVGLCNGGGGGGSICREAERKALVDFKNGLEDPVGRLSSSWVGLDCCSWTGVRCHNHSRHVVRLDLRNTFLDEDGYPDYTRSLKGEIRSSLLLLNHLRYLDLSYNDFEGNDGIPAFLGSLVSLQYLNLSGAGFRGPVPQQLGNLSSLRYLDLSYNYFEFKPIPAWLGSLMSLQHLDLHGSSFSGHVPHELGNLSSLRYLDLSYNPSLDLVGSHWLTNLSSLEYLNLIYLNLSKAPNLLKSLNTLPLISEIHLSYCNLDQVPLSLGHAHINFTNLRFLDLSYNKINSTVPLWLFQLSALEYLDLSYNSFQDLIPHALGKLCNLSVLDLSGNKYIPGDLSGLGETFSGCFKNSLEELHWRDAELTGQLPNWLGNLKSLKILDLSFNSFYGSLFQFHLPSLQTLDLSHNKLNGTIPKYLAQLFPKLFKLDLSCNNLPGILTEAHFDNLTKLEYLSISSNTFELALRPEWVPPLKLKYLYISDLKLGLRFPSWLQKLKILSHLKLSNASIADALPDWPWNFSSDIISVDLSHNEIRGKLPGSSRLLKLQQLDLSHNYLDGQLPQFSSKSVQLDPMHGSFSSSAFSNTSMVMPNLVGFYISSNKISGRIPRSLCELENLQMLDLSHNLIEGIVPDCWNLSVYLASMDLSHNSLFGPIPASIYSSQNLLFLHLSHNEFSGELPSSFQNCTSLRTLDIEYNKISGSIPIWFGENSWILETLELQHNMLTGTIPPQLGNLTYLRVIDVANNQLSGAIPHCFGNLTAMKTDFTGDISGAGLYIDNIVINMKGREVRLESQFRLLKYIDLSNNMLSGEIPEELAQLSYLQSLNLSKNYLSGKLSEKLGDLRWLEVLDLSMNDLSGVIPSTMTNLTSLDRLNLSYNNFFGEIPYGGQLQVLPYPSIYSGNQGLCGLPLDTKCEIEAPAQPPMLPNNEDDDKLETIWFYVSVALGFIFGFWAIFGALILKNNWRYAYFRSVDHIYNKIYVIVAVNLTKMKNKCGLVNE